MARELCEVQGLIFKRKKYKEADVLTKIMTKDHGIFTIDVRGALRPKSRLGAATLNFSYGKYIVNTNWKGISTLRTFKDVKQLDQLYLDLTKNAYSSYVLDLLDHAFVEYKDGIFRSRSLGVVNLPLEFKNKVAGKDYYVASVPFFAYWNKELQTNDEFVKHTISKISVIKEYLSFREAQGKEARVIVTCEDSDDVDNFAKWCMQTEILLEHMDKIYVTGEGIHRAGTPLEASFARLKIRGDSYTLSVERPDFI